MGSIHNETIIEHYGENSFTCYRIPGIVVTPKGTILTYYETRTEPSNDWSTRGVGMRRSTDGGKTFKARQMIAECADLAVNNPLMIAGRDGTIHFFWQKDYRQAFYQVSKDDGISFSEAVCITPAIEQFRERYDWSLYAFGPGHGIALKNGRLVVPIWLANGEGNDHYPTQISTLVSDDNGKSWQAGEIIYGSEDTSDLFAWPNETQCVELSDGSVMLNIRHNGSNHVRYVAVSPNGKDQFSTAVPDPNLPDSICFGSIVRGNTGKDLLFVNCANRKDANAGGWAPRRDLTVRLSEDEGKSWSAGKILTKVGGYADIAASPDGERYYCFFEKDNPEGNRDPKMLTLAIFNKEWLCEDGE